MLKKILASLLAISINFSLMAQPSKLYESALTAIRERRCADAVDLFNRYKALEMANLAKNPEFAASIDRQISLCRKTVLNGRPFEIRGVREGIVIKGRKINKASELENLSKALEKAPSSTVYRVK